MKFKNEAESMLWALVYAASGARGEMEFEEQKQ